MLRETGAIEATGHKIIAMPSGNGKLTPEDVESAIQNNAHFPHMAKPRLVYISNATEFGTVYTKVELQALLAICRSNNLLLLVDGARLGAALSASKNDVSLSDLSRLCDFFWIGGTKAGALMGEAIVIANEKLSRDFSFHIKQRGALLAGVECSVFSFASFSKQTSFSRPQGTLTRWRRSLRADWLTMAISLPPRQSRTKSFRFSPTRLSTI